MRETACNGGIGDWGGLGRGVPPGAAVWFRQHAAYPPGAAVWAGQIGAYRRTLAIGLGPNGVSRREQRFGFSKSERTAGISGLGWATRGVPAGITRQRLAKIARTAWLLGLGGFWRAGAVFVFPRIRPGMAGGAGGEVCEGEPAGGEVFQSGPAGGWSSVSSSPKRTPTWSNREAKGAAWTRSWRVADRVSW